MKKVIFLFVFFTSNSYAGQWYDVPVEQIEHFRAEGLEVKDSSGGYILQYKTTFPGDVGCSARDFAYIRKDDVLAKEMYAIVMAAIFAKKKLKVYTTGCSGFGNVIQSVGFYP